MILGPAVLGLVGNPAGDGIQFFAHAGESLVAADRWTRQRGRALMRRASLRG